MSDRIYEPYSKLELKQMTESFDPIPEDAHIERRKRRFLATIDQLTAANATLKAENEEARGLLTNIREQCNKGEIGFGIRCTLKPTLLIATIDAFLAKGAKG